MQDQQEDIQKQLGAKLEKVTNQYLELKEQVIKADLSCVKILPLPKKVSSMSTLPIKDAPISPIMDSPHLPLVNANLHPRQDDSSPKQVEIIPPTDSSLPSQVESPLCQETHKPILAVSIPISLVDNIPIKSTESLDMPPPPCPHRQSHHLLRKACIILPPLKLLAQFLLMLILLVSPKKILTILPIL